jgi:hypothetical protein
MLRRLMSKPPTSALVGSRPVLRAITLGLAFIHAFPAQKHLGLFLEAPSLEEAWKGFGALLAVMLYVLPVGAQARTLHRLWMRRDVLLTATVLALAFLHGVPALDHVPRFWANPNWGDCWRGFGSVAAIIWFSLPWRVQSRLILKLTSPAALWTRLAPSA